MYILGIFVVSANLNLVHIQQKEGAKGNEVTKSFFLRWRRFNYNNCWHRKINVLDQT